MVTSFRAHDLVQFRDSRLQVIYGPGPFNVTRVYLSGTRTQVMLAEIPQMVFDPLTLEYYIGDELKYLQLEKYFAVAIVDWSTYDPEGYLPIAIQSVALPKEIISPESSTDLVLYIRNYTGWNILALINQLLNGPMSESSGVGSSGVGWTITVTGQSPLGAARDTWRFTECAVTDVTYGTFLRESAEPHIIIVSLSYAEMTINPT